MTFVHYLVNATTCALLLFSFPVLMCLCIYHMYTVSQKIMDHCAVADPAMGGQGGRPPLPIDQNLGLALAARLSHGGKFSLKSLTFGHFLCKIVHKAFSFPRPPTRGSAPGPRCNNHMYSKPVYLYCIVNIKIY